jgi:hypothetical protein
MQALNLSQGIERIAPKSSRRTLVKQALALGVVAVASGHVAGTALGQETAKLTPAVIPVQANVIAEWTIANPPGAYMGFDSVWVPGHNDRSTTRIDPVTNNIIAKVEGTGSGAEQALAVGDALWVTGQNEDTTWIDPVTNTVSATMPLVPGRRHHMAYGFDSLWITTSDYEVDRIDPATGEIIASISFADGHVNNNGSVLVSGTAVWVEYTDGQQLIKINPATNSVASRTPYAMLVEQANAQPIAPTGKGTESLWIADGVSGLLRVDPTSGVGLTFLSLTEEQTGTAYTRVTDEAVWIAGIGQINRVDVASNRIDATYMTSPGRADFIAIGFGSIWLAKYYESLVQRLDIAP